MVLLVGGCCGMWCCCGSGSLNIVRFVVVVVIGWVGGLVLF